MNERSCRLVVVMAMVVGGWWGGQGNLFELQLPVIEVPEMNKVFSKQAGKEKKKKKEAFPLDFFLFFIFIFLFE